ncbi:hypothetical protein N7532_007502 [Penicillium argentinense]|uniref:Uncharacterized protein n=1 Tax=Penicillium argentinense TaxID=1131581 RepID=A0A9W9F7T3_9EURO|nr:uncharacterized protein N7532_007502 [Penicillium argentinense]KAJ5095211.1 hypothetical protein N7532_007502 [Penicillium argentinense]
MQLSRTAYRAALLHLSVNPLPARAIQPTWSSNSIIHHQPQTPTSRLSPILFPVCAPLPKTAESMRHSHTMSSSNPDSSNPKQETNEPQPEQTQPSQEQLYLPETSDASDGQPKKLEVGADGVALDHLGPMVVNVDGTLSRIGNWEQMSEIEKKNTLRIIGRRNKQRLEALKTQGVE